MAERDPNADPARHTPDHDPDHDDAPAAAADSPVDLVIEDDRWLDTDLFTLADRAARATLAHMDSEACEIVVMGCDDDRIAELNAHFRGKPAPTNVLSWPSVEHRPRDPGSHPAMPGTDELGDIAISYDTCAREAAAQGKTMTDHVTHLLVHAILHLIGYDHEIEADAVTMEETEIAILAGLGLANPYQ